MLKLCRIRGSYAGVFRRLETIKNWTITPLWWLEQRDSSENGGLIAVTLTVEYRTELSQRGVKPALMNR
tara:strand:+ start:143 stop:349 length:207 start_codon:yes stop_codon:yes gene_type:complete